MFQWSALQIDQDSSIYILDVVWVECMTSPVISFTHFTEILNLNISRTNVQEIENMHHVPTELQKHEWKFGKPKNLLCSQSILCVLFVLLCSKIFQVLPNFHKCFYNSIETQSTCFLFLLENNDKKKEINLLTLIIKCKFSLLASSLHQQRALLLCLHQVIQTPILTNQCTASLTL